MLGMLGQVLWQLQASRLSCRLGEDEGVLALLVSMATKLWPACCCLWCIGAEKLTANVRHDSWPACQ